VGASNAERNASRWARGLLDLPAEQSPSTGRVRQRVRGASPGDNSTKLLRSWSRSDSPFELKGEFRFVIFPDLYWSGIPEIPKASMNEVQRAREDALSMPNGPTAQRPNGPTANGEISVLGGAVLDSLSPLRGALADKTLRL
jgi:hypothetical protein